ncbi:L,D-transpeptidase family protein [Aurantimonas sp. Leaf443]|uniref:L,D-transpeptidase family protein n=1 Tax=Aurantimonas sp. Leaf443 TaxID=1736378 RepID=UPI0006FD48EF|nr:L,D-transpeptidase family protein [Aurantimonas sp. Leaf443]KQT87457.1 hypothetical protein ASG48_16815 [Aurantimonas sp. Leaf443]
MPSLTSILVRRSPLSPTRGILAAGPLRLACALGRSGTSILKREGDGATPVAAMALLSAFRRGRRVPGLATTLPLRRVVPGRDGWCDASGHAAYNRPVRLPFPASTESLARDDRLYDAGFVLDWNVRCRARNRGSAIFLHVAREGYAPTEGCVALSPGDLRRLLPFLRPGTVLRVLR